LDTTVQDLFGAGLPPVRPLPPDQATRTPLPEGSPTQKLAFRSWTVDCLHQYVSPAKAGPWPEAVSIITIDPSEGVIFVNNLDQFLAGVRAGASRVCEGKPSQGGQDIFRLPAAFHVSVAECDGCGWRFQATFDPVIRRWIIYDNQYFFERAHQ
jgi:hypothetical protein